MAQAQNSGCSKIAVFIVAVLCGAFGFAAGVGGLYAFLSASDEALTKLGLVSETRAAAVSDDDSGDDPADPIYALVYPIEETLRIEGKLDRAKIRDKVTAERFAFQECFQKELDQDPARKGEIAFQFTISGSNGEVIASVARQNTTGSKRLADCVTDEIETWTFDKDEVGKKLSVVKFDVLFLPISNANAPTPGK